MEAEGELRKRLRVGFGKAIDNVAATLNPDAFSRALPKEVDAEEVSTVLVETFRDNAQEVFREVSESFDLPEQLAAAEALLGPTIKGKRYPPPARQEPLEAMRILQIEKKLAFLKQLQEMTTQAEAELESKQQGLREAREHVNQELSRLDALRNKLKQPSEEDADTESDES